MQLFIFLWHYPYTSLFHQMLFSLNLFTWLTLFAHTNTSNLNTVHSLFFQISNMSYFSNLFSGHFFRNLSPQPYSQIISPWKLSLNYLFFPPVFYWTKFYREYHANEGEYYTPRVHCHCWSPTFTLQTCLFLPVKTL